jgi:peptidoglycan/LPS O-acetylase OafA/YrhL
MINEKKRIFGLDLLRSIAIILVLVTHTVSFLDPQNHYYEIPVYTGYLGVEFFFVLSGFLIGTILLKIHYQDTIINFKSIKLFWIRRWFRTLPNYYLMFLLYAALAYFVHHFIVFSHLKYLAYLVFLQNTISYQPNDFFPVAWSLSIEEWFYLLFPLLLYLFSQIFPKNRSRSFFLTVIFFIIVELLIRICIAVSQHNYWDEGFRKMMPIRLDSIAIGVLTAYVRLNLPQFWLRNVKKIALLGIILMAGLTTYFTFDYVVHFSPLNWDHNLDAGLFLETLFFTLLSLSIAMFIPYLCSMKAQNGISGRVITFVSKISYSIYLNHLLIILALSRIFKHFANLNHSNIGLFAGIWVCTIVVSWFQYQFFELKMTALRNKFGRKKDVVNVT